MQHGLNFMLLLLFFLLLYVGGCGSVDSLWCLRVCLWVFVVLILILYGYLFLHFIFAVS